MDTTSFKASVEDVTSRLRPKLEDKIEEAKQQIGSINGRIVGFIQDHPAACLLGAIALGYLVARVARQQR